MTQVQLEPPVAQVTFDDTALKRERRKERKRSKSVKSEAYHHTPSCAASSFSLTATPEAFSKKQTHKLSRPILDLAKARTGGVGQKSPSYVPLNDERSSGEYERSQMKTPVGDAARPVWSSHGRFATASQPTNTLFSSSVLGTNGRLPSPTSETFTRARQDWTESDENTVKSLRRSGSVASTTSKHSKRRHSVDITSQRSKTPPAPVVPIRVRLDDDSIRQVRSRCFPKFSRAHSP